MGMVKAVRVSEDGAGPPLGRLEGQRSRHRHTTCQDRAELMATGSIVVSQPAPTPELRPTPRPKSAPHFSPLESWRRFVNSPTRSELSRGFTKRRKHMSLGSQKIEKCENICKGENPLSSDFAAESRSDTHPAVFQSTPHENQPPPSTRPSASDL
jgi:hypothetical protein